MKIACIGTGYVGLVTGTCLAELGHEVVCADIDKQKITKLKKGVMPIYEPGLEELVRENTRRGRLSFTTSVGKAIQDAQVVFSGVGTPEDKRTGKADLQYVYAVAKIFAENIRDYKILVNKSTVPVGTGDEVEKIISTHAPAGSEFSVVSNPEFLREGAAIKDFLNPDRVVIGTEDERAVRYMEKIYKPLARAARPVIFTDRKSAEVIKYASNAFLATKISFINEVANFCDVVGANAKEVAKGMGLDERIGSRFLAAGIGYGGSCFPKDVSALIQTGKEAGAEFSILEAVDRVNDIQKLKPIILLKKHYKKSLKGKKVCLWGLAFKPRTDDVREAPALYIAKELLSLGVEVRAYDPVAIEDFKKAIGETSIMYAQTKEKALSGCDALIVVTEWDEFRSMEPQDIRTLLAGEVVIDGRNIYSRKDIEAQNLFYYGIGV